MSANTPKLTSAQEALLREIYIASDAGMVISGTKGSTAKVLRREGYIAYVVNQNATVPRQAVTAIGRQYIARLTIQDSSFTASPRKEYRVRVKKSQEAVPTRSSKTARVRPRASRTSPK